MPENTDKQLNTYHDTNQQKLYDLCRHGTLADVKKIINRGGMMNGIVLGYAAQRYSSLPELFDWLLEQKCPVDMHTWFHIVGSTDAIKLAQMLQARGYTIEWMAYYAAYFLKKELLRYAVSIIGWSEAILEIIAQLKVKPDAKKYHVRMFRWAVKESGIRPTKQMKEIAFINGNKDIVSFITWAR